jgi:hypothetical protein
MKKTLLIIILSFSTFSFSQGLSLNYSSSNTVSLELSNVFDNTLIGVNCSFYVGNPNIASFMPINNMQQFNNTNPNNYFKDYFTTPHNAIFATIGHQSNRLSFAMRLGMQNTSNYTTYGGDKFSNSYSPFYYKEVTPYDLLLGVSFAYKLEDDFALNLGYDNFNNLTFGFTVYWGKSNFTNHLCKKQLM